MKWIHAGEFAHPVFDETVANTLEQLGIQVIRFKFSRFLSGFLGKVENYLTWIGPLSLYMNYRLYKLVQKENPDFLFIWRGTLISPYVLKRISVQFNTILVSYNNDDPFSPLYQSGSLHQKRVWKVFKKNIPAYDVNAVFRPHNIIDYNKAGSKKTILFPPYYSVDTTQSSPLKEKNFDVLFVGLYTQERAEYINFLLDNRINVKIYGSLWKREYLSDNYSYEKEIVPIIGQDYLWAIQSAKVCLAFLSKLNKDCYTYRNFEIPALNTLMLSERTKELQSLFKEGEEAVFFSSKEELLKNAIILLKNHTKREAIAKAGQQRAINSAYDVKSRVVQFLADIKNRSSPDVK